MFQGEDAEAVVLHFMQPARFGGLAIDQDGLARADEADVRQGRATLRFTRLRR
jgi:hypothetical protein